MNTTLQESFDRYLLDLQNQKKVTPEIISQSEQTFHLFSEFLIYYSDLFQSEEDEEEMNPQEWEASLDNFINQLMQGGDQNHDPHAPSLEELPLERVNGEYLRDFIAWHLLREPTVNSLIVQSCAETLQNWLDFNHQHHLISDDEFESSTAILQDTLPDAKRAAIAAHLLLYHIRLGMGISPRLRGTRFTSFKEGHARITLLKKTKMWLSFDNEPEALIGPVILPEAIIQQLRIGDVIDIELGYRGDTWNIVDIGPVYPAVVYVEAEEMKLLEKRI